MKQAGIIIAAASVSLAGCSDFKEGFEEGFEEQTEAAAQTEPLDTSAEAYTEVTRCMVVNERLTTIYNIVAETSDSEEKKRSIAEIATKKAANAEEFGVLLDQMVEASKLDDEARSRVAQAVSSEIETIENDNEFVEMAEAFEAIAAQCDEDYVTVDVPG